MTLLQFYLMFVGVSVLGIALIALLFNKIIQIKDKHPKSAHIADLIRNGAMTFLKKEYSILAIVIAVVFVVLFFVTNLITASAYLCGALSSMLAGFIGMKAATRANEATTLAAKNEGERAAFLTALFGGSVMGFVVASLGLLGLGTLFYLFVGTKTLDFVQILACFGLGASSIALFARVGGGIFTKAADVGADLVGK
jgi:K(+)-stimulated pyrophosphate-energized sodium pump